MTNMLASKNDHIVAGYHKWAMCGGGAVLVSHTAPVCVHDTQFPVEFMRIIEKAPVFKSALTIEVPRWAEAGELAIAGGRITDVGDFKMIPLADGGFVQDIYLETVSAKLFRGGAEPRGLPCATHRPKKTAFANISIGARLFLIALLGTAFDFAREKMHRDVYLLISLRKLGHKVAMSENGPHKPIEDGNRFLAPLGKKLIHVDSPSAPARYAKHVVHVDNRDIAVKVFDDGFDVIDGDEQFQFEEDVTCLAEYFGADATWHTVVDACGVDAVPEAPGDRSNGEGDDVTSYIGGSRDAERPLGIASDALPVLLSSIEPDSEHDSSDMDELFAGANQRWMEWHMRHLRPMAPRDVLRYFEQRGSDEDETRDSYLGQSSDAEQILGTMEDAGAVSMSPSEPYSDFDAWSSGGNEEPDSAFVSVDAWHDSPGERWRDWQLRHPQPVTLRNVFDDVYECEDDARGGALGESNGSDDLRSPVANAECNAAEAGPRCDLGAADGEGELACLNWALNALGAPVPTNMKGPFRALEHGNTWLAELGLQLVRQPRGPSGPGRYAKWEPPPRRSGAHGHFKAARVHVAGITVTDRRGGRFVSMEYRSLDAIPSVLGHKWSLLQEVQLSDGDGDPLGGAGDSELDAGAAGAREPSQGRGVVDFPLTQAVDSMLTEDEVAAAIRNSMVVFTRCEPNEPAWPPQRSPDSPDINIVHDGNCLYHCGLASEDMTAWMRSHKPTGNGLTSEQVRSDEDRAKHFRGKMMEIIARDRGQKAADRLLGASSDSYPGLDDMEAFCEVIQGQAVAQSDTLCQIKYGDRYPLAVFIRHHQASGADHFDLIQSWRHAARPSEDAAGAAVEPPAAGRSPAGTTARQAQHSSRERAAAASQMGVDVDDDDAADPTVAGSHSDALGKRLKIPGAAASTSDFDALFGEAENYSAFLSGLVPEPRREDDSILTITAGYRKCIATQQPDWSPWLRRLAMEALCVYRLRFSEIYTRELVLLLHVILGDDFLRGHNGVAYFWNNKLGCFDKFDGLLPEWTYFLMKSYLLSLEGMFRSFTDDVYKNDSAILAAVDSSFGRQGREDKKARLSWIDNAVFNYGSKILSKGKGKGKALLDGEVIGEGGKGDGKGKGIMQEDGEGEDLFAADEGAAAAPAVLDTQQPNEPRYIFQANAIARVGHALQSKVKTGDLISYYCEWCSTPKPDVKGFAVIDVAYLYDTQAAIQRVERFYRQTYWANAAAFQCCQAAIALAKRGMNIDQVFFFWGSDGVGLSLTTPLLSNMLGSNLHRYFDPQVFYMDDEMREQVESLVGSIATTAQEKPEGINKSFREDLFKKMATADGIFGRLPYAVLTKVITLIGWKRMELNKLITFGGVPETAFDAVFRRSRLIRIRSKFLDQEWISNFLPDSEKHGIFPRQPDLKEFMQAGPAGLAANILQCKYERQNDEAAARRALDDYTLRGGDHGMTEMHMRAARNLPARSSRRARGSGSPPGIDLAAGAEDQHLSLHYDGIRVDRSRATATHGSVEAFCGDATVHFAEQTGFAVDIVEKHLFFFLELLDQAAAKRHAISNGGENCSLLHADGNCIPAGIHDLGLSPVALDKASIVTFHVGREVFPPSSVYQDHDCPMFDPPPQCETRPLCLTRKHLHLKEVLPNLKFLSLDPVHLPIAYEYAHGNKRSPGSRVLRLIMAKLTKVRSDLPSDQWGPPHTGVESIAFSLSETDARSQILHSSMGGKHAQNIVNHLDGDVPWATPFEFIRPLAALSKTGRRVGKSCRLNGNPVG
ncbi:unnamed protein product [Prorocentrum cordatum]|uniref:OTU domain-containing protein n=1 Tax=Prorocentrum cordatum TaxID=2364126 RepID=A0ABN9V0X6_9DINO|nr:unnamed protein product [Polarella glacialis]